MPDLYVITGASAGLGLHAALTLAKSGASLCLSGRNAARLAGVLEQARAAGAADDSVGLDLKLDDLASVKAFAAELAQRFPGRKVVASLQRRARDDGLTTAAPADPASSVACSPLNRRACPPPTHTDQGPAA